MKKSLFLVSIFISFAVAACGQSKQDEIQRLQEMAKANEQLAMQAEARARKAELEARKSRYVLIAIVLAERSIETQEKELAALMAVQAYNFSALSGNYSFFNDKIYNGLLEALKKYNLVWGNLGDVNTLLKLTSNKPIFSAVLPNSQYSVVAEQNGNLKFVRDQGAVVRVLAGHRAQVDQIKFSNSGKLMATSGKDNTIRIWDLTQLNERPLVITESVPISKLTFSSDDTYIFYELGGTKVTINQRPLDMKLMAADLCNVLSRNFTAEEWNTYVATDLPYEQICPK